MPGGNPPGTESRFFYDWVGADGPPAEGDVLRTPAGSCYLIDDVRPSPTKPGRVYLNVTKLDDFAVELEQEGVHPLHWYSRGQRRPVSEAVTV